MNDLTEEERKFIENDYTEQELNKMYRSEKINQDIEYYESSLKDKLKEINIKRQKYFEDILKNINLNSRDILNKDDQNLLRIPISMLKENEKNRRKLVEETLDNIKNGIEFLNYNRLYNSDFKLNNYFSISNLYINLDKIIVDDTLNLVDVFLFFNNKEYRLPLNSEQSSEVIGNILLSGKEIKNYNLYPDVIDIINKLKIVKTSI